MSEKQNQPDSAWFEGPLRRVHAEAGECPGTETLFVYAHDRLNPPERDRVAAHCLACGECELMASSFRSLDPPNWGKIESALGTWKTPSWRRSGLSRIFWNPVSGYALALLLAGVIITQKRPMPGERPVESATPEMFAASPVRLIPDERGAAAPPRVKRGRGGSVLFTFFIPVRAGAKYKAELTDSEGHPVLSRVEIQSVDGIGQYFLSCPVRALRPGGYQLLITESGAGERTFRMSFGL